MPPEPGDPIEELLRLLVSRERIANSLTAAQRDLIRETFERIAEEFRRIDPPGAKRTRYRRDRVERALAEIQATLRSTAPELERAMKADLARIGRNMGERARLGIVASLGTQAADLFSIDVGVTQQRLRAIMNTDPIQGRTLREHTRTWAATQYNRVRDQIRLGMTAEESTEDIMRRVIGSQAGFQSTVTGKMRKTPGPRAVPLYRGGVYSKAARDTEAIVRTAVTHVSNVGMMETFRANEEVVSGVEYVATLDDRTCFVAGTPVLTPHGYVPIESIRPGDFVIGGGRRHRRRVLATQTAETDALATVETSDGYSATCTPDHFWYVVERGWVEARNLRPGDRLPHSLVDPGPRYVTVQSVDHGRTEPTTVYDIEVEEISCFVVANVVVHNSALCASLDGTVWPLDSPDIIVPGENTHFNCRSVLVAVPAWDRLGLTPPEEGTRIARDMRTVTDEDMARAVSNRRRTSGFGDVERIPSSVNAEQWLRGQRASVQNRVLGAKRAEMFRSGNISLAEMIRSDNTLIPLNELLRN